MKNCAFTGHRPKSFSWKYDETARGCVLLKQTLTAQIAALADNGVTDWFCGMALGTDLWCAQIVLDLKKSDPALKLHCVLPCKKQTDGWSDSARDQYCSILSQSDSIDYVSREYYDGCMIERNHRLVESAELLLAVYNGTKRSGTGATIRYAQKLEREIWVIDPVTREVTHFCGNSKENFEERPQ